MSSLIDNASKIIEFVEKYGEDASHILDDNFRPYRMFMENVSISDISEKTSLFPFEVEEAFRYISSVTEGSVVNYGEVVDIFIK